MMGWRATTLGACGVALLGLLAAPSCTALPGAAECEAACAVASRCGLLPSALGGAVGEPSLHNEQSCVARCLASEEGNPQVAGLLAQLQAVELPNDTPLCDEIGTTVCNDLVAELEHDPDTTELDVTATLTIRMVNLVSHVTSHSLESWCCLDHRYDLDGRGNDVDELAAMYDMIGPTHACLQGLHDAADAGSCTMIQSLWRPPMVPEGEEVPEDTSDCRFARLSTRLRGLGMPMDPEDDCAMLDMPMLAAQLAQIMSDWKLVPSQAQTLIAEDGTVRDIAEIRAAIQQAVDRKLRDPGAPLELACDEVLGDGDCTTLDREQVAAPATCEGGPPCSPADCLAESPACDAALCDALRSPPGRDCGELGVSEVRLGYRNGQGLEVLGEPIHGCEALRGVTTTFEAVGVGPLVPIAVISGTVPGHFAPDEAPFLGDGSYSWIVLGNPQWVGAGEVEVELPSPLVEWTEDLLENPLEVFGWLPRRFPVGQLCDIDHEQCESYSNGNCDNGIDDDGDGFTDHDSAWCDELFQPLVDRCVVMPLRQVPPPQCMGDGEPPR
jgi:hypothetical protein